MKPIDIRVNWWTIRPGGGIALGFKISAPVQTLFSNGEVRKTVFLNVGLLFMTIHVQIVGTQMRKYPATYERNPIQRDVEHATND